MPFEKVVSDFSPVACSWSAPSELDSIVMVQSEIFSSTTILCSEVSSDKGMEREDYSAESQWFFHR